MLTVYYTLVLYSEDGSDVLNLEKNYIYAFKRRINSTSFKVNAWVDSKNWKSVIIRNSI